MCDDPQVRASSGEICESSCYVLGKKNALYCDVGVVVAGIKTNSIVQSAYEAVKLRWYTNTNKFDRNLFLRSGQRPIWLFVLNQKN